MMERTIADLRAVMDHAERAGVTVVIENHEDFTGPELARIVEAVGHPRLGILYDYGNSQMVLEDPEEALDAVLPHVRAVHVKDHVMVRPDDAGRLTVAGVPVGYGALPVEHLTRRLLDSDLRRITYENVWGYSAPIAPEFLLLDPASVSSDDLVRLEQDAFTRGLDWFKASLKRLGVTGYRATPS